MHRRVFMFGCVWMIAGCGQPVADSPRSAKFDDPACCCEINRSQLVALLAGDPPAASGDWPMFGGTLERNMVNTVDKNIPTDWSVEEGKQKNVKWQAQLGSKCMGGPVVADGKVFVATNNGNPRDPKVTGQRAVLMAFNEADGKFLWQTTHQISADVGDGAGQYGLCSTPAVAGQHIYYVTPSCEVVCATTAGKVVWIFDMMKELKVSPHHWAACSPLVAGDLVLVITSNGISEDQGKIINPKAPSFLALHRTTGKVVWQSNLPGGNIIEGQWGNPTVAKINGQDQAIFPGGDAYVYGFELATGKLIWKFNCQPIRAGDDDKDLAYPFSTVVVHDNKLHIGLGVAPENLRNPSFSHFLCVDPTKSGDVSPKNLNHKDAKNNGSALVWSFGGKIEPTPKRGRRAYFGRTISTCAVHDGVVYISEESGYLHCLDAKTGQRYWEHDFKAGVWGSPLYVDGKVYIGSDDGEIVIFKAGKKKEEIAKIDMGETIVSTPVVARGVLYVAAKSKLYAIAEKK